MSELIPDVTKLLPISLISLLKDIPTSEKLRNLSTAASKNRVKLPKCSPTTGKWSAKSDNLVPPITSCLVSPVALPAIPAIPATNPLNALPANDVSAPVLFFNAAVFFSRSSVLSCIPLVAFFSDFS